MHVVADALPLCSAWRPAHAAVTALARNFRRIAAEAYALGVATPGGDLYTHGYARGVADLARLFGEADPAVSDRLIGILRAAGLDSAVPPSAR